MRKYVSFQEQRKEIDALRDTINGELNRIALTEDPKEVDQIFESQYSEICKEKSGCDSWCLEPRYCERWDS